MTHLSSFWYRITLLETSVKSRRPAGQACDFFRSPEHPTVSAPSSPTRQQTRTGLTMKAFPTFGENRNNRLAPFNYSNRKFMLQIPRPQIWERILTYCLKSCQQRNSFLLEVVPCYFLETLGFNMTELKFFYAHISGSCRL